MITSIYVEDVLVWQQISAFLGPGAKFSSSTPEEVASRPEATRFLPQPQAPAAGTNPFRPCALAPSPPRSMRKRPAIRTRFTPHGRAPSSLASQYHCPRHVHACLDAHRAGGTAPRSRPRPPTSTSRSFFPRPPRCFQRARPCVDARTTQGQGRRQAARGSRRRAAQLIST